MEKLKINGQLSTSKENLNKNQREIYEKLDEFIVLASKVSLDSEMIQDLQARFEAALRPPAQPDAIQLSSNSEENARSLKDQNDLSQLSFINKLDKRSQKNYRASFIVQSIIRVIMALLLILLGFGMIIMPAPPYFEMFTLFYLSKDDGVTIMDLISLFVAFAGVYLLFGVFLKTSKRG